ncbi:MAG: SAM-dependent methyltransferase, partial [Verrucomicrobiota bacterium]
MPALSEIIRAEIARSGPMPFRRFMELALYEPNYGYYASGRAAIGRRGDFVTSVSVSSLFGRLLAGQFQEMWELLGQPPEFTLVEQGANTGDFAQDVLTAAAASPAFFAALRYVIVEPFPANTARQQTRLAELVRSGANVTWHAALAELPPFTGVHFSNELLDAMPAHLVVFREGAWMERHVVASPAEGELGFAWQDGPLSTEALQEILPHLPAVEGYQTEINLEAPAWIETLARRLQRGYVLVADYGFSRSDLYLPERIRGTLSCYRQQRRSEEPLAFVGDQDITAHVDFTTLAERAEASGLTLTGFTDQHHFMMGLAKHAFPDATAPLSADQQRKLRALATLMHPSLMGRAFQFLALAKDAPAVLRGYEFARDPRARLVLTASQSRSHHLFRQVSMPRNVGSTRHENSRCC